jgi:hypothetical protein
MKFKALSAVVQAKMNYYATMVTKSIVYHL